MQLKDILKKNVQIIDSVLSWEEAIAIGASPLLSDGVISEGYVQATIDAIKEVGFYIVLTPTIAIPHARPEDGALKNAISLLKVNDGVTMGKHSIKLLFTISATSSEEHIKILALIAALLDDEITTERIIKASTPLEIIKIILSQ